MKITIDDQYHSDDNNNYEEDQYAVDESGNLNLFINVDGEFGDEEPVETINKDNICNKEEEKKVIESNFSENIWHDEKYSERYSDIYSEIENDSDIGFNSYNQVEEKGTIEAIS
ncbi:calcium-binding protein, partial [Clostridium perfringens]|nr:calcium-binding protein [Clostridium perfringens]